MYVCMYACVYVYMYVCNVYIYMQVPSKVATSIDIRSRAQRIIPDVVKRGAQTQVRK